MSRSIRRWLLILALLVIGLAPGSDLAAEDGSTTTGIPGMDPRPAAPSFRLEAGRYGVLTWDTEHADYRELRRSFSYDPSQIKSYPMAVFDRPMLPDEVFCQLDRLELQPIRCGRGPVSVCAVDMTGDGRLDLLVRGGKRDVVYGARRHQVYAAPGWSYVEWTPAMADVPDPGPGPDDPILLDIDGDGLKDLVRGTDDGRVVFRRSRGVPGKSGTLEFTHEPSRFFPFKPGAASHPAAMSDGLLVGNLDGDLRLFIGIDRGWLEPCRGVDVTGRWRSVSFVAPAVGSLDNDRKIVILGAKDGGLAILIGLGAARERESLIPAEVAGTYTSPCLADVDDDGDLDLLCGNREGKVLLFRNTGTAEVPLFEHDATDTKLSTIDVGESSAPAAGDVNGDGKVDLVVGNQKGELSLFLGPDWQQDLGAFKGLDVGELAAPALILNDDGKVALPVRLVVGRLTGDVLLYEAERLGDTVVFVERDSWSFTPDQKSNTLKDYYRNCYFPEEEEVRGPNDAETFKAYCDLLASTPEPYVDEVVFSFVNTPPEVLRAMARLGQADLLLTNAKAVYEMAKRVPYAKIVERDGYTTLAYASATGEFVEAPPEIYYWWVVHPRLLYEIPSRIDATWWDKRAKERGLTDSKWWKHEPKSDIRAPSEASVFWRPAIVHDDRHGGTIFDRVSKAKTLRDALEKVNAFVSHGPGFMRFGYETQDMQPWLVYAKYYGSCGEHSIIGAACARTMLIPATVVSDRGEDHQWNEWWDTDGYWHHWDASGGSIDTPWSSTEGRGHKGKTVSSTMRWRGSDRFEATTTTVFNDPEWKYTARNAGYTDTADVTVRVEDAGGAPIDGALVIVRSHWDNRNMISIWGYTDGRGRAEFDLGYEPNGGYTIEALTPFGSAGVQNYTVEENRSYELELRTPGGKPDWMKLDRVGAASPPPVPPARERSARLVKSELRPPNLITSSRFRIGEYMTKEHGYRGTRGHAVAVDPGELVEVFIFSPDEFEKFTRGEACVPLHRSGVGEVGRLNWPHWKDMPHVVVFSNLSAVFTTVEIDLVRDPVTIVESISAPTVRLAAEETTVARGATLEIRGEARDDIGVTGLSLRCSAWAEARDVAAGLDSSTGEFRIVLDTGEGGPWPAGDYTCVLVARNWVGTESTSEPLIVTVEPARVFKAQKIRQDNADDPLKNCSWVYGPFDLDGTDRFFLARTTSLTPDFDCDMHLYRDKNGNGRVDGPGERVAQSTTPTANERIYLENPLAGTYWLFCQGWKVEGEFAPLDVEVYPTGTPRAVVDIEPAGRLANLPPRIAARLLPFARIDPKSVQVIIDGNPLAEGVEADLQGVTVALGPMIARNTDHTIEIRARHHSGRVEMRKWTYAVDTIAPKLTILSPVPGTKVAGKVRIEVEALDEGPRVTVTARLAGEKDRRIKPVKDRPGVFAVDLDAKAWDAGERFVWIVARDAVGNETEKVLRLSR
jgi:FG-GAP-like repeat/Transglutaminase-like superfamily